MKTLITILAFAPLLAQGAEIVRPTFITELAAVDALTPLTGIKKDVYESTPEFNSKVCKKTHEQLKIKQNESIELPIFPSDAAYDADKKEFKFTVFAAIQGIYGDSLRKYVGINIGKRQRSDSIYAGSNAFGVAKYIAKISESEVIVLLPVRAKDAVTALSVKVPATPAEARKIGNDLRLIISTTLTNSCFVTGTSRSSPTIDSPEDRTSTLLGLIGSPNAKWKVVSMNSGEVIKSGKF